MNALNNNLGKYMFNLFSKKQNTFSTASLTILEDTINKIREQFYEFSHIDSQFVTYDEKSDQVIEFVYND